MFDVPLLSPHVRFAISVLIFIASIFLWGWAFALLWGWFLQPVTGFHLGVLEASGIRIMVRLVTHSPNFDDLVEFVEDDEVWLITQLYNLVTPLIGAAIGYGIHLVIWS